MDINNNFYKINLGPAKCALDLGDGSERAEYVNQDYIINRLGRPHRNINLMYTYYPNDSQWPQRISVACHDMEVKYQWDYPYDDYFPYGGGIGGNPQNEPFTFIRDIRKHGQDVTLTLTIDCSVTDDHLIKIAEDLKNFGRIRLRINHECVGDWFTHNRRFSYKEIGAFFVRFHKIIKNTAPNVQTVFCAGFAKNEDGKMEHEEEFLEAYRAADVWSCDCYLALHFNWPYSVCEKDGGGYNFSTVDYYYDRLKNTAERLKYLNNGKLKPFVVSEFNTDGDVAGSCRQGESVKRFARKFRDNNAGWFTGFTLYQFRDRGRLGLEMENPNNPDTGIEQPLMNDYKELLNDPYFMPKITDEEETVLPAVLRWGSSEDAEGLAIKIRFEQTPTFCEINFDEPLNLMMELNGTWFYKAPHVKTIDLMPAFFKKPIENNTELAIKIFAPPATGENIPEQSEDWALNYYTNFTQIPKFRIRYEAVAEVK